MKNMSNINNKNSMKSTSLRTKYLFTILVLATLLFSACSNGKSARQYYKEGMESFKNGSYKEAAASLSEAVKKNPEKAEYYISYGMSLIKTKQFDQALVQFDKAVIAKDNKIVRENNKKAYRGKGITYYESNQFDLSIEPLEQALEINELDELNLDILSYKADAENKSGQYEAAVKTYSEIIKLDKKDAKAYANRAQMESYLGKTKEALTDYDKAISLDKNNYDLYFGKYFIYTQLKDTKGAQSTLEKALAIKAKSDEDLYHIAQIHFYQEDYQKAKSEFTELVDKKITDANFYLGQIYEMDSDYKTASKHYERYLNTEVGKKSSETYNQLGLCYLKLADYEKAYTMFSTGLDLNESTWNKTLSFNEIVSMEHLAKYKEALTAAKVYLKSYPDDEDMAREYEYIQTRVEKKSKSKTKKN